MGTKIPPKPAKLKRLQAKCARIEKQIAHLRKEHEKCADATNVEIIKWQRTWPDWARR